MRAHTFRPIARLALVGFLGLTTRAPAQPPGPLPSESMVTVRVESIRGGTADVHGVVAPDGGVLTSWRV